MATAGGTDTLRSARSAATPSDVLGYAHLQDGAGTPRTSTQSFAPPLAHPQSPLPQQGIGIGRMPSSHILPSQSSATQVQMPSFAPQSPALRTPQTNTRRPGALPFSPLFFRRLARFREIDFEYALWEMFYLCVSPQRVFRNIYYHRQTKNQWARDDPAFVLLLAALLTVCAVAYGLVYGSGIVGIFLLILRMVLIDFLLVGFAIASLLCFLTNRFLLDNGSHVVRQTVEWAYAFDVHCNSFLPLCLVTYVLQLFFLPVVTRDRWICLFVGNTFYLIAFSYYVYVTFLGYRTLPFLKDTSLFLYPIVALAVFYLFSLLGFNISRAVLHAYFE